MPVIKDEINRQKNKKMEINIPIFNKTSLMIANIPGNRIDYPSSQLQKGLLLFQNGQNLTEEAVGFGVPVFKRGLWAIFAGDVELSCRDEGSFWKVTAIYKMNMQEKIKRIKSGIVSSNLLYSIKYFLAALHRTIPVLRGLLMSVSTLLRRILGWETRYEPANFCAKVKVVYTIDCKKGKIAVKVKIPELPKGEITEVVMMNEQGAHFFDCYLDSSGAILKGKRIGSWDEVKAEKASFLCASHQTMFTLKKLKGAKLFRGQELIGSRLAWSGFGYSFSPLKRNFRYDLKLERVK